MKADGIRLIPRKHRNTSAFKCQWKSWQTARILCFNKSFIRNCTDSTGILSL